MASAIENNQNVISASFRWTTFFTCLLLGSAAHYLISENDIFFFCKLGERILQTREVITQDFISHTQAGAVWYNHEWLSTVLFYWVSKIAPHFALFPTLRALVVFVIFLQLAMISKNLLSRSSRMGLLAGLWTSCMLLLVFSTFWYEVRPELFCFPVFVHLLALTISKTISCRKRLCVSFLLLLLWANLHSGTVPFGLALVGFSILRDPYFHAQNRKQQICALLFLPCLWLMTPIGIWGPIKAWSFLKSGQQIKLQNPDLQGFAFNMLDISFAGFAGWLWVIGVIGALLFYPKIRRLPVFLGSIFGDPIFFFSTTCLMFALGFCKVRAFPYATYLAFPVWIAVGYQWMIRSRWWLVPVLVASMFAAIFHAEKFYKVYGFGINSQKFPIQSARFIQTQMPPGKLYNYPDFGGFLSSELSGYKVFQATLLEHFLTITNEDIEASKNVESYAKFLRKYDVNLAVDIIPQSNAFDFYPVSEWAPVFFDNKSVVYVRRIPQNAALIEKFEYHFLFKSRDPEVGARLLGSDPKKAKFFEFETDRCLRFDPENVYCLLAKGAFELERGHRKNAEELVERAKVIQPELKI